MAFLVNALANAFCRAAPFSGGRSIEMQFAVVDADAAAPTCLDIRCEMVGTHRSGKPTHLESTDCQSFAAGTVRAALSPTPSVGPTRSLAIESRKGGRACRHRRSQRSGDSRRYAGVCRDAGTVPQPDRLPRTEPQPRRVPRLVSDRLSGASRCGAGICSRGGECPCAFCSMSNVHQRSVRAKIQPERHPYPNRSNVFCSNPQAAGYSRPSAGTPLAEAEPTVVSWEAGKAGQCR
jgi:hypothetical protein